MTSSRMLFYLGILLAFVVMVAITIVVIRLIFRPDPADEDIDNEASINNPKPPPQFLAPKHSASKTRIASIFPSPQKGNPSAMLICVSGPTQGRHYALETTVVQIGANRENEIVLSSDEYVSGTHARIKFGSGCLYLTDSGSSNGTWLNDERLTQFPRALALGDDIRLGKTTLRLAAVYDQPVPTPEGRNDERTVR